MKNAAVQERTYKIVVGAISLIVLSVLALRFQALPERVPIQFGLDGSVSNTAPRMLFAAAVVAGLTGFNAYINWFRDREQPMRFMTVIIFIVLCGALLFSMLA